MTRKELFGKRLIETREKKGLSRKQAADELNIVPSTYLYYENGKRTPDLDTIDRIAEYYNVSVDYLMGRTNKPTENTEEPTFEHLQKLKEKIYDMINGYDSLCRHLKCYISNLEHCLEEINAIIYGEE